MFSTIFFFYFSLDNAGVLEKLFKNSVKQNIFLKISKQNRTGCSDVWGYMIVITRDEESKYEYNVTKLNRTTAETKCNHTKRCYAIPTTGTYVLIFKTSIL